VISCGKWLSLREYAKKSGLPYEEARGVFDSQDYLTRRSGGVDYIWVDDPEALSSGETEGDSPSPSLQEDDHAVGNEDKDLSSRGPSESGLSVSGPRESQDLVSQTERALALVERSVNAFMMMHEEVVQEKDRSVERSQEGMEELEEEIQSQKDALRKLELALKEKDQEIADLKMLVDILENRGGSTGFESEEGRNSEVGDIMEEQLKYITEQQMIKDLLEK